MAKIKFKDVPSGLEPELEYFLSDLVEELTYLLSNIDWDNLSEELKNKISRL